MYGKVKKKIEKKYGSVNRLAKVIGVEACDLYTAFAGTKPMYPKYRRLIADALGEDVTVLFREDMQ